MLIFAFGSVVLLGGRPAQSAPKKRPRQMRRGRLKEPQTLRSAMPKE